LVDGCLVDLLPLSRGRVMTPSFLALLLPRSRAETDWPANERTIRVGCLAMAPCLARSSSPSHYSPAPLLPVRFARPGHAAVLRRRACLVIGLMRQTGEADRRLDDP